MDLITSATFRLTLDVTYNLNGTSDQQIRDLLENVVAHATNRGMLTGDTRAVVCSYDSHIDKTHVSRAELSFDSVDTETRYAIATLAAQFALGTVEEPDTVATEGALDEWGDMGFVTTDQTDENVAWAVNEAKDIAMNQLSVGDDDTEDTLRSQILGY